MIVESPEGEGTARPQREEPIKRLASRRASYTSVGVALIALLALLCASPAAFSSAGGTTNYEYKVIRLTYDATGDLAGGRAPGCVGTALWEGKIKTEAESDLLSSSPFGKASLTIGPHGSSGSGYAKVDAKSQFSEAFHRETTACDENGNETAFTMTPCAGSLDSKMHVSMRISGGVGTRLKLVWDFFQYGGASGTLVPDTFSCVEPFRFPDGTCRSKASLGEFNHLFVHLLFRCFYSTSDPPAGSNYTVYTSSSYAQGVLELKRKN
ncbi:MAG: hypothetical protein QOF23_1684 [Solirubrobacterales bacterium]|nr:hypothetical protein [Solirubrobacterales bacterium]